MGAMLLVLGIAFFLWAAFSQSRVELPKENYKTVRCPPHKWIYGVDGFLVCDTCHRKPGYTPRE